MTTRTRNIANKLSQGRPQGQLQVLKQRENKGSTLKRQGDNMENVSKKARPAFGDITNKENIKGIEKKGKAIKKKQVVILPKTKKTSSQPDNPDVSWEVIELSQGSQGSQSSNSSQSSSPSDVESLNLKNLQLSQDTPVAKDVEKPDWEDIDQEHMHDPNQAGLYVNDIFNHYKKREIQFQLKDYLPSQPDLSANMRAVLVDWLVEVQENFELNHETLYLAVKMVDHHLSKHGVMREKLQLVGATALFIACKFDERCPPVLDDFLYICDDAYMRDDLIRMEIILLRSLVFDLGIPLSYRFLRRYAKCARASMDTLTLARFILEMSLMEYSLVTELDSKVASAALLLALKMKNLPAWNSTLIHYTQFEEEELMPIVKKLNNLLSSSSFKHLSTIRAKYSHKVFYEVAKIPALDLS